MKLFNIFNWIRLRDENNRVINRNDIYSISDVEISAPENEINYGEYRGKLVIYRTHLTKEEKDLIKNNPNKNEVWLK